MASDSDSRAFGGLDAHAIPFVTISADGSRFEVNPDAQAYLRSLTGKVGIVSIAGMYRTGKSYLLNQLMGNSSGFTVGPTVQACTKGIWIWGRAIKRSAALAAVAEAERAMGLGGGAGGGGSAAAAGGAGAPAGHTVPGASEDDMDVVFMDTEGLGSTGRSESYDARIFALALLLSSYFIYNSKPTIDSAAIERLSLVTNLTKHVRLRAGTAGDDKAEDLANWFPNFTWVVRDFALELKKAGRDMRPNEYLEDALKPELGGTEEVYRKNGIRQALTQFFPTRDCFLLPLPLSDESRVVELDKVPFGELRDKFRQEFVRLRAKVFRSLQPKAMHGRPITGGMIAVLADTYAQAFNDNKAPVIATAWDRAVDAQCEEAIQAAVVAYNVALADATGATGATGVTTDVRELEDLQRLDASASRQARRVFFDKAVRDPDRLGDFEEKLALALGERFNHVLRANEARSQAACERLVLRLHDRLLESVRASARGEDATGAAATTGSAAASTGPEASSTTTSVSFTTVARAYARALETLKDAFVAEAVGPAKHAVLATYLAERASEALTEGARTAQEAIEAHVKTIRDAMEQSRRDLAVAEGRARAAEERTVSVEAAFTRQMADATARATYEKEGLLAQLSERKSEVERLVAGNERQLKFAQEREARLEAAEAALQTEVREARLELSRKTSEYLVRLEERVAGAEALATAAEARRVAEARYAELELECAEKDKVVEVMAARVQAAENEMVRLREQTELLYESVRVQKELVQAKIEEKEECEYQWGVAKAKLAEKESQEAAYQQDLATFESLASALKVKLAEAGRIGALRLDAGEKALFDRL